MHAVTVQPFCRSDITYLRKLLHADAPQLKQPQVDVRTRVATTASSVSLPLAIDPDSHSERLVDERNVFFAYKFFLTPSGFFSRVEGGWCSGVGVGTYTKHDVAEVYASYNRCMLHAYPNVPRSSTGVWDSPGIQVPVCHVVIYHSFNLPRSIGDREDEGQIRYVINRLVQKLIREHRHHRIQDDDTREKQGS
jgi:hypothetical protein